MKIYMNKKINVFLFNQNQNKYYLYDNFITPRASGSVNNTYSEPIGGLRKTTDTGNKISIIGGVLSCSGGLGSPSQADPFISWPSINRLLGQRVFIKSTTSNRTRPGLRISLGGTNGLLFSRTPSSISIMLNENNTVSVYGSTTNGVVYSYLLIFRNLGGFAYIKGGTEFPNWSLLWISNTGNTASFYPSNSGFDSAYTISNVIIPKGLYVPTPLQSDGFSVTTTDGKGNAENNGPVGNSWAGSTWNVSGGTVTNIPTLGSNVVVNGDFGVDANWTKGTGWAIAAGVAGAVSASSDLTAIVAPLTLGIWYQSTYDLSGFIGGTVASVIGTNINPTHASNSTYTETNRATSTALLMRGVGFSGNIDNLIVKSLTTSELFRSLANSSSNIIADVAITRTAGTQAGIVINLDSTGTPANFVVAYLDGNGNCLLDKCVAGIYTNIISGAVTYSASAVLRVIKDGTNYRLFYNELVVGTVQTISDEGIINNTIHGLFSTYSGNIFDNFVIWARGNENQYNSIDSV